MIGYDEWKLATPPEGVCLHDQELLYKIRKIENSVNWISGPESRKKAAERLINYIKKQIN